MQKQNTVIARRKKAGSTDAVKRYCPKDPYRVISAFFRDSNLPEIRKSCNRFITTAFECDKEKNLSQASLNLYFLQDLLSLAEAAHLIYKKEKLAAVEVVKFTLKDLVLQYGQINEKVSSTRELPMYLEPVEWVHPQMVIADFFDLRPMPMWKHILHRMAQSATGSQPILSVLPFVNTNLWKECLLLHKLIEAAWIMEMRELPEMEE
jgi:hypothetical protein